MKKMIYVIVMVAVGMSSFARPFFDKEKDLLVAQFDSKPDTDDIHAQAALGCMLAHKEFKSINYIAVSGAYGDQSDKYHYIDSSKLFDIAFGEKNRDWTDAHTDWEASVARIKTRAEAVINAGGRVWVQEAGQSNFTADWVAALIDSGIAKDLLKERVVVVQHSKWNEKQTNPDDLAYLKDTIDYVKIADGNRVNKTPSFNTATTTYLSQALTAPNRHVQALWEEADAIIKIASGHYTNPRIQKGGVDFSDCVENHWIFNDIDVTDIDSFWAKYILAPE